MWVVPAPATAVSVVLASCRRIVGYVGWSKNRFLMRGSAEAMPGATWRIEDVTTQYNLITLPSLRKVRYSQWSL